MTDLLLAVLLLGLANAAIAQIVTFSSLFEPVRNIAEKWEAHPVGGYFREWITCPLCFGTWSAAALTAATIVHVTDWPVLWTGAGAWVVGTFAVHTVGLIAGYVYRLLLAAVEKLDA